MCPRTARVGIVTVGILAYGVISSPQTLATRQLMKNKLVHAQRILEAVMTSDFNLLGRETDALSHTTQQPGWWVLTTPEYKRYSTAFLNATNDLTTAARDHDLDAVALHYATMTMTCYECHRYVKRARIADLDPIREGAGSKSTARQAPTKPAAPDAAITLDTPPARVVPFVWPIAQPTR